ncbi:hypothetical protein [Calorimonas adulescens]|uniref:hypothetical protein n=1 Tax=Calorimonas adulescens TaxID=2606906 RepID=UPI00193AC6E4|nr:hypothetical protein [Calorimonas adulescens]
MLYKFHLPDAYILAVLIADSEKIKRVPGWKPQYTELNKIIETAWKWEMNKKL